MTPQQLRLFEHYWDPEFGDQYFAFNYAWRTQYAAESAVRIIEAVSIRSHHCYGATAQAALRTARPSPSGPDDDTVSGP